MCLVMSAVEAGPVERGPLLWPGEVVRGKGLCFHLALCAQDEGVGSRPWWRGWDLQPFHPVSFLPLLGHGVGDPQRQPRPAPGPSSCQSAQVALGGDQRSASWSLAVRHGQGNAFNPRPAAGEGWEGTTGPTGLWLSVCS